MPETIRTAHERLRSRPRRGGFLAAFVVATLCSALSTPASADGSAAFSLADDVLRAVTLLSRQQVATLTLTLGLLCFAVLATIVLLAEIDRLKTLLLSQPQVLVAWAAGSDEPEIFGATGIVVSGSVPERVPAVGAWLAPAAAQRTQHAGGTLRSHGRGFVRTLTPSAGRPLEAEG